MASKQAALLLRHIRGLVGQRNTEQWTDRELLQRFTKKREEAAFAQLVQRHGPMVLRVCQRVLHQAQDAEDVFQATFLVLTRKAAVLPWQESVASWLYQVAYHLALKAKRATARRYAHESRVQEKPTEDPLAELTVREAQVLLDEELSRLPEKYQAPLVLCYLEGRTQEEAARQLGCSLRTLTRRLERARGMLHNRLARRGLTLSAVLSTTLLAPSATPAGLLDSTIKAALAFAAGSGVSAISAVALAEGAVKVMFVSKLKMVAGLVLALGMLTALGYRLSASGSQAELAGPTSLVEDKVPAGETQQPNAKSRQPETDQSVDLKWKFEKDKTFYQEMKIETQQTTKGKVTEIGTPQNEKFLPFTRGTAAGFIGLPAESAPARAASAFFPERVNLKQTFLLSWTPKNKDPDGNWTVVQKIVSVQTEIDIDGKKIRYDSTKDVGTDKRWAEFFKTLVGSEFMLAIAPDMKVTKIEGYEHLVRKLAAADPQVGLVLPLIAEEVNPKQMAELLFALVPDKAVKVDDLSFKQGELNLGPMGTYAARYQYRYAGREGKLDKIQMDAVLIYEASGLNVLRDKRGNNLGDRLPFQIKAGSLKSKVNDLKIEEARGTILFDPDKGRIDRLDVHWKLEGKMILDLTGNPRGVELSQTQQTTLKILDVKPTAKK
jgi:RNA polymerase sigma factor (sigma-70 family)